MRRDGGDPRAATRPWEAGAKLCSMPKGEGYGRAGLDRPWPSPWPPHDRRRRFDRRPAAGRPRGICAPGGKKTMTTKPAPACDRCGVNPGDHIWVAASRSAEKVFGEFRLCPTCIERLRSFFANGKNRPVATQKQPDQHATSSPAPQKQPDQHATSSPAPENSRADEIPIRRSN